MNDASTPWLDSGILGRQLSRRDVLKQLSVAAGALLAGCTPLRIVLKDYPEVFKVDRDLGARILQGFVATVIPGAPTHDPDLIRMFYDEFYPFHEYCGFFVADLSARSERLFGDGNFDQLGAGRRARVVQDGLDDDATTARLYQGAIFISQISFYAGIYDDEKGCPFIGFNGANSGYAESEMCYENASSYLALPSTSTGNYV